MKTEQTKDLVFKQLDMICGSLQNTAKEFGVKSIPINLIEKTVKIGKIDLLKLGKKDKKNNDFFIQYNKLLDALVNQCRKDAQEMGAIKIPLLLFESHIDIIKSSFMAGLN